MAHQALTQHMANTRTHAPSKFRRASLSKQGGWTFWSLLFVMMVILFFTYIGMQLVPVYAVNENVKNAMGISLQNTDLRRTTRGEIIRKMNQQLYLDGTHKLLNYKTDLKVSRSQKKFVVETKYRREIPLFFNLSLLVSFHNVEERDLASNS